MRRISRPGHPCEQCVVRASFCAGVVAVPSGTDAQKLFPAGSVYSLPLNRVVELSIPGGCGWWGLAIVFAEDVGDIAATEYIPESWQELYPIFDRLNGSVV